MSVLPSTGHEFPLPAFLSKQNRSQDDFLQDSMVSVLPSTGHEFPLPGFLSEGRASQVHVESRLPLDRLKAALDGQLGVQVLSFQVASTVLITGGGALRTDPNLIFCGCRNPVLLLSYSLLGHLQVLVMQRVSTIDGTATNIR